MQRRDGAAGDAPLAPSALANVVVVVVAAAAAAAVTGTLSSR